MAGPRVSPEAHERLALLARVHDGFALAEEDLKVRGAGELWGTRQTGLPSLRVADLVRDADLVQHAHREAAALLDADPQLLADEHRALRERLLRSFGEELSWRATG
jgi:ATP-dependent DNA helicase RecG